MIFTAFARQSTGEFSPRCFWHPEIREIYPRRNIGIAITLQPRYNRNGNKCQSGGNNAAFATAKTDKTAAGGEKYVGLQRAYKKF